MITRSRNNKKQINKNQTPKNQILKQPMNKKQYRKKNIPKKIREEVWIRYFKKKYQSKCYISWCSNTVDVFNFQVGHNIPESKGGTLSLNNLKPICDRCNYSMGSNYTIDEWNNINNKQIDKEINQQLNKKNKSFKSIIITKLHCFLTYLGF